MGDPEEKYILNIHNFTDIKFTLTVDISNMTM